MNILILNWRDTKNPQAGGAEQITERYADYWSKKGAKVFWISNVFSKSEGNEVIKDIHIIRVGPYLSRTTILNLFSYPLFLLNVIIQARKIIKEKRIDFIIDEIHGLPFFTPILFTQKKVLLVCEVAGEIWDKMWPFPVNIIGKFLEKIIFQIYGRTEMWAISENTRSDILKLNANANVKILPLGIDIKKYPILSKTKFPSAVFVARLVPMKGIEDAIDAALKISKDLVDFKLFVIGRGTEEYECFLKNKVNELKLNSVVIFLGYVSEEDKYKYLSESHFLIHPSYKEGFGLTVLEAGLVGTPSIVKKGSSLDELVNNGEDGFIVHSGDELAEKFIENITSTDKLNKNAKLKAEEYSWELKLKESDNITGI